MSRSHAVVVGAGVCGLLAAQVLAEFFGHVTLVAHGTDGAPVDVHRGTLTPSAAAVLDDLFPGLLAGLEGVGTPVLRQLDEMHLELAGHRLCRDGALPAPWYQPSRGLLETHLRARAAPAVVARPAAEAVELLTKSGRVTGVALLGPDGSERLAASLVVDATGGEFLQTSELTVPQHDLLGVDVRQVTVTSSDVDAEGLVPFVVSEPHPARPLGVAAAVVERGNWRVTAIGYGGHHPPVDREGLLTFLEPLLPPPWYRAVAATAWTEPQVHDFAANTWHRWDQVLYPPDGLLVVGDGLCVLNPVHSHGGMSLAVRQTMLLREALTGGDANLPRRWYQSSAKALTTDWARARTTDRLCAGGLDEPGAAAKLDKLLHKVLAVAETDTEVAQNLLRVQWGLAEPSALVNPALIRKLVVPKFPFGRMRVS
ncbi:MAG: hypothetical protein ACT4QG_04605 [Sporichthyaceae bacterium]